MTPDPHPKKPLRALKTLIWVGPIACIGAVLLTSYCSGGPK